MGATIAKASGTMAGMRKAGQFLIVIGLIASVAPTIYAMVVSFNNRAEPDPKLIELGMRIGMIGVPLAIVGLVMVITSHRRSHQI